MQNRLHQIPLLLIYGQTLYVSDCKVRLLSDVIPMCFHSFLWRNRSTRNVIAGVRRERSSSFFSSTMRLSQDSSRLLFLCVLVGLPGLVVFWIFSPFRSSLTLSVQIRHVKVSWSLARR